MISIGDSSRAVTKLKLYTVFELFLQVLKFKLKFTVILNNIN